MQFEHIALPHTRLSERQEDTANPFPHLAYNSMPNFTQKGQIYSAIIFNLLGERCGLGSLKEMRAGTFHRTRICRTRHSTFFQSLCACAKMRIYTYKGERERIHIMWYSSVVLGLLHDKSLDGRARAAVRRTTTSLRLRWDL